MSEPSFITSATEHARTWGLFWASLATGLLLVGSTLWVERGLAAHTHELAGVHSSFLLSHHDPTLPTLEEQLRALRPFGGWSLVRLDPSGRVVESVGPADSTAAWATRRPTPTTRGRYQIASPLDEGTLVIEYVPLLAEDLQNRARMGVTLAVVASALLVLLVSLWIRFRNRMEALTLEAERTRHLAQLGTLSAVIAHELRNPLTVLMGHVQLLEEDLPESRSLRHVASGANRLDALLDSLLAFAKSGEVVLEATDPVGLMRTAAMDCGLDTDIVEGTSPPWRLDPTRMRQVLLNLLRNAVQASPNGGVRATVRVEQDTLVFEVQDEGSGIPTGMHETIFEPFHTTRTKGTGLGLAVARAIVEKHGGTLTAHDLPRGALFAVRIPA